MKIDITKVVKSFTLASELDDYVINILFAELLQPGLILLPSGNTFEQSIYPRLDALFASQDFAIYNTQSQETIDKTIIKIVHPELKLSHLDEIIPDNKHADKHYFANAIKRALPNITRLVGEKFYAIDIENLIDFERYLKINQPRVIVAGLGADPSNAHIAFIGEEYINTCVAEITLSDRAQKRHSAKKAVTIGTDIFKYNSLEKILIVAKGKDKAPSLKAGFEDDTTGLGYLVHHHLDKLCIFADHDALGDLDS